MNENLSRGLEYKSEQDDIPQQIKLVEHRFQKKFSVLMEDADLYERLTTSGSRTSPMEFRGNKIILPWQQYEIVLKEKYPDQYQEFLEELRKIRHLERESTNNFLNLDKKQEYPIFIPTWFDGKSDYEDGKNNDFWLQNEGSEYYFARHQYKKEYFDRIPEGAKIFFSHCTTGRGVESLAKARPDTNITAGDINPEVCKKCSEYIEEKGITNVEQFVDAPAEYLTPVKDDTFDAVFTEQAIWTNPYRAFTEYVRIIRPGGALIGSSSNEKHDTTIFFKMFSDIYKSRNHTHSDPEFTILTVDIDKNTKRLVRMDTEVLEILSRTVAPQGEDSETLPNTFDEDFAIHPINRKGLKPKLLALGYTLDEITNSLERLSKISKYGHLTHEGSYHSIALQDKKQ